MNAVELDLTGRLKSITCADADAVGYLYRDSESKLRINFAASDNVLCGSRPAHLAGADVEALWSNIFID